MRTGYPKYLIVFCSLPNFSSLCFIGRLNVQLCDVEESIKLDLVFPIHESRSDTNLELSKCRRTYFCYKIPESVNCCVLAALRAPRVLALIMSALSGLSAPCKSSDAGSWS